MSAPVAQATCPSLRNSARIPIRVPVDLLPQIALVVRYGDKVRTDAAERARRHPPHELPPPRPPPPIKSKDGEESPGKSRVGQSFYLGR